MQMSTKGRYAARAALDLALHYPGNPIRLKDIATRLEISQRYLEQIMTMLVASGYIRSKRGQDGGFSLAKSPETVRLDQVIQVVEGSLALVDCASSLEP